MRIRVLDIVEGTSVDGPGLRTSIYLAGCHHRCPGCHNPESWAMDGGREASVDELLDTIRYNDFNVTLSGGDPLYHPKEVRNCAGASSRNWEKPFGVLRVSLGTRYKPTRHCSFRCNGSTWWSKDALSRLCATRSCASAAAPTSASSTLLHQKGKQFRWN